MTTAIGPHGFGRPATDAERQAFRAELLWQRGQIEETAEFYESEARRPASNAVYAAFCATQAKRLREAAEPCPDESL